MEFTGERYIPSSIDDGIIGREHWQRYLFSAKLVQGKDVLDIASGAGYGTNYLAQTARYAYGVDISNEAIEYSNQHYVKNNLKFIQGSIENIPFDENCLDIVVSFETIEHVDASKEY
jgi:2-polyprenyl-3-methyl-5-hydroxy-6-metoxy-1,4-benzoquinol methylase